MANNPVYQYNPANGSLQVNGQWLPAGQWQDMLTNGLLDMNSVTKATEISPLSAQEQTAWENNQKALQTFLPQTMNPPSPSVPQSAGGFNDLVPGNVQNVVPPGVSNPSINPGVIPPPQSTTPVVGPTPTTSPQSDYQPPVETPVTPTSPGTSTGGFQNLIPQNLPQPNVSVPVATVTNVAPTAPTVTRPSVTGTAGSSSTPVTPQTTTDPRLQAYMTAHPDLVNNWNNDVAGGPIRGYGSLENYIKQDMLGNGTPDEKAWAQSYTPPTINGEAPPITNEESVPTAGDNFHQTQTGQQSGGFSTNSGSNFAQNQTTGSNTVQNTGEVAQTDSKQQTNTGENSVANTQNTNTSTVNDALGFGALLKGQTDAATNADTTRNNFLQDLVKTGGQNMNSQFEQAIHNSLTGSAVTGAGDSARARAAGYAGAEVARKNTGDRLAAANALSGPTAVQTLTSAGTPFLGKTDTTTGKTTTDTTGFQNLVNTALSQKAGTTNASTAGYQNTAGSQQEAQAGTATGNSKQSAAGLIPQAQQVSTGGGGCIVCTAGIHQGLWRNKRILRRVVAHKLQTAWPSFRYAARGYFFLFTPFARALLTQRRLARLSMPVAKAVVYEELRISGRSLPFKLVPWITHWTWHGLCSLAGRLPVSDNLTDTALIGVAKQHNVFFQLGGGK